MRSSGSGPVQAQLQVVIRDFSFRQRNNHYSISSAWSIAIEGANPEDQCPVEGPQLASAGVSSRLV